MGLDMFGFWCESDNWNEEKKRVDNISEIYEFHYWRKNYDIHEWMQDLWISRELKTREDVFNRVELRLHPEELSDLNLYLKNLPNESNSLISVSQSLLGDIDNEDVNFIKKAFDLIENGKVVFYYSWH